MARIYGLAQQRAVRPALADVEDRLGAGVAVDQHRRDSDPVRTFLEESYEFTGAAADRVATRDLYDRYQEWCKDNHFDRPVNVITFVGDLSFAGARGTPQFLSAGPVRDLALNFLVAPDDRIVLAKMQAKGLQPARPADRLTGCRDEPGHRRGRTRRARGNTSQDR